MEGAGVGKMSIEAMKEALEVMKNIQFFDKEDLYGLGYDIDVLSKAIAQAEQAQPVAWLYDFIIDGEVIKNWITQDFTDIENSNGFNVRNLYATQ
jgi:5S rRNA maturation endonuclease (ribonuclease M5)